MLRRSESSTTARRARRRQRCCPQRAPPFAANLVLCEHSGLNFAALKQIDCYLWTREGDGQTQPRCVDLDQQAVISGVEEKIALDLIFA
jgi:hypothetical protein